MPIIKFSCVYLTDVLCCVVLWFYTVIAVRVQGDVCSQIRTRHLNTLCGQNGESVNVKLAVHQRHP